jgi:adenylate cyclase
MRMKLPANDVTIAPDSSTSLPEWPELRRQRKAIVVVDVVESVRLMQANEADVIDRWRRFVNEVRTQVLPVHGGRLVKSLGDGLLLEFESVHAAVGAALELDERSVRCGGSGSSAAAIRLRVGVHIADVVVDELDLYGSGVNLAARLASLADAGQIVVSAEARDGLADGHDCRVVDLGECFLKHYAGTVRAFRVSKVPSGEHLGEMAIALMEERPSVAVVPFTPRDGRLETSAIGDAIADDVIAALSRDAGVRVISSLSTSVFRGSRASLGEMRSLLRAAYVVKGSYQLRNGQVSLWVELCDARDGLVLWADTLAAAVTDIFNGQDEIVHGIALHVGREVLRTEVHRARCLPISNLDGYTLYAASVFMLNRLALEDFARARTLLEHLSQRYPRSPAPFAMLAKWHGLRIAQGWADDVVAAGREAQYCARRALLLEPDNALALAMDALMMAQLDGDLEQARKSCEAAVQSNPQEPHAWMNLGGIHSYLGNSEHAESFALRAIQLSPMDPARFLFDVFVAAGKLSAGKFDEAEQAARSSIRLNAMHPASHRLLTISLAMAGKIEAARKAGQDLLRIEPQFAVNDYARRYAGRDRPHAAQRMQALLDAGLPA